MTTEEIEQKLGEIRDICQTQLTIIDRAITELIDPDLDLEDATVARLPRVLRDTWIDLIRGGDLSIKLGLDLER